MRNRVIGTNNSTGGNLRGALPPPRDIFVSRVLDGTTEMMKDFLSHNNVNISKIDQMSHPDSKYCSFKITISVTDKYKVLDSNFWPNGIQCKMWRSARNNFDNDRDVLNISSSP